MKLDDDSDVKLNSLLLYVLAGVITLSVVIALILLVADANNVVTPAPLSLSSQATAGKAIFLSQEAGCNNCHPSEGRGGGIGPRLSTSKLDDTMLRSYIRNGHNAMPSNSSLSDAQISEIIDYLHAIKPPE